MEQLCDIYGFEQRGASKRFPRTFAARSAFWQHIASGELEENTKQTLIRHPALRVFARLLSHTIQNKPDPGRMYTQELTMLYYAVGDALVYDESEKTWEYNMGVIWAKHLLAIQKRAFAGTFKSRETGRKKRPETFGSLLTPIFTYCGVPLAGHTEVFRTKDHFMDAAFFVRTKMFPTASTYTYSHSESESRKLVITGSPITRISTAEQLAFLIDADRCIILEGRPDGDDEEVAADDDAPEPSRKSKKKKRATPRASTPEEPRERSVEPPRYSQAAGPIGSEWADFYPPTQPTLPVSQDDFHAHYLRSERRQYRLLRRIWSHISGCVRPSSPPSPGLEEERARWHAQHDPRVDDMDVEEDDQTRQSADQSESRPTAQRGDTMVFSSDPVQLSSLDPDQLFRPIAPTDFYGGGSSRGTAPDPFTRQRSRSPQL